MFKLRVGQLYFLWIIGGVLLFIGVQGDRQDWWDELGYIANLVAGATAACFGVPVAATVIQRFLRESAERARRHDLLTFTKASLQSMHSSLTDMSLNAAAEISAQASVAALQLMKARYHDAVHLLLNAPDELHRIRGDALDVLESVRSLGFETNDKSYTELVKVERRWRVLRENVLVQAEVIGLPLIADQTEREIDDRIKKVDLWRFGPLIRSSKFVDADPVECVRRLYENGGDPQEIFEHNTAVKQDISELMQIANELTLLYNLWSIIATTRDEVMELH